MRRSRFSLLGLLVFGLLFVAFVVRGFGQILIGQALSLRLAGIIAGAAGVLVVALVAFWILARLGVTSLEQS
ncbi:MAG: hypothetical protein ABEH64_12955 [Salinirussus sp.]